MWRFTFSIIVLQDQSYIFVSSYGLGISYLIKSDVQTKVRTQISLEVFTGHGIYPYIFNVLAQELPLMRDLIYMSSSR